MQTYPKPGDIGGRLIRKLVSDFRKAGLSLPIDSHILIAVSGGSDSVALAHLLLKYGRRIADRSRIKLLHVNHGWRGVASDRDAAFVVRFGKKWGVPVLLHKLAPPTSDLRTGQSLEEAAREARKSIFEREAGKNLAKVFTAHQADDLAETFLWRLFTGAAATHAGGIAYQHGVELRPFLRIRKTELQAYLREEKQPWREDSTNQAGRFLRSKMRQRLMPAIEELFPRAIGHLSELALQIQTGSPDQWADGSKHSSFEALSALLGASGLRMRRAHSVEIGKRLAQKSPERQTAIDLPGGWRLFQELSAERVSGEGPSKRWVLEASGRD